MADRSPYAVTPTAMSEEEKARLAQQAQQASAPAANTGMRAPAPAPMAAPASTSTRAPAPVAQPAAPSVAQRPAAPAFPTTFPSLSSSSSALTQSAPATKTSNAAATTAPVNPTADAWAGLLSSQPSGSTQANGANSTNLHLSEQQPDIESSSSGMADRGDPEQTKGEAFPAATAPNSPMNPTEVDSIFPPGKFDEGKGDGLGAGAGAGAGNLFLQGEGTAFGLPDSYEKQASDMWAQNMSDYDASLQGKLNQTYADEARAGRSADVQSAMLGQGVSGGGAQGGQAQVALGGMAQRQDVMNKHYQQGLTMKMAYLETLIKRAEATKDRALQERLQAEADKTMMLIQGAGIDTTNTAGESAVDTDVQDDGVMSPEEQAKIDAAFDEEMQKQTRRGGL